MEVKLQSFNHLRCKEDALQGKSLNTINMERKCVQRSRCVVMERGVAFKNICFLFSISSLCITSLSLLVSLSLLSDPPGPCINTFLFPHHLPPSPPLFCLSLFEQIKALSLFDKTHSVASSSWEGEKVSKRVMKRGEGAGTKVHWSLWSAEHLSAALRATTVHKVSHGTICHSFLVHLKY